MKMVLDLRKELFKIAGRRIRDTWRSRGTTFSAARRPPILYAASVLYETVLRKDQARLLKKRTRLPVPVISLGNLSVGGTGKTPLAIWMCEFLIEIGFHPAVLTRGYGARAKSPGRIPSSFDERLPELFGDEPVMMSEYLPSTPVWVGADRAACGRAALSGGGVDVFVLDDGFQHLSLDRDLDLVLLDCRDPFGNRLVLPAGPLREPCSSLKRADAFVMTHAEGTVEGQALKNRLQSLYPTIPAFACNHRLLGIRLERGGPLLSPGALGGRRAVAFAGIASPESFFGDLRRAGIDVCEAFDFADHHSYTAEELLEVLASASKHRAGLIVTTAKDCARLPAFLKNVFAVAEIGIDFGADGKDFRGFIEKRLKPMADGIES
ncbi:MAG: tetraacyldisaccharide 4'-kinase [Syntrophobacteraceae bacterium]|nr:tetraacyldisaccharide 4'-kinase [Syntrophobacteraceae bacterium]